MLGATEFQDGCSSPYYINSVISLSIAVTFSLASVMGSPSGEPDQSNYDKYRLIRTKEAPVEIETFFVENGIDPTGLGEPSLPPVMGALANALYEATGSRLYDQPFAQRDINMG
ncbi:MAG: hypothetical protein ACFB15_24935 [Cyclobacteriaceae bacterium]